MDKHLAGYMSAFAAAFLVALSPVAIKLLLSHNNPVMLSLLWMISATAACFVFILLRGEAKNVLPAFASGWKMLILLGILNAAGTLFWFLSINLIGPSISAFLGRVGTIILVFLCVFFLREKFNFAEGIGVFIALAGVFVITFYPVEYVGAKIAFIAIGSTSYSIAQMLSKDYVKKQSPLVLTFILSIIITLAILVYAVASGSIEHINPDKPALLLVIPFLSDIISPYLMYVSYKNIDVSKSQVVRSSFPFIVVVYTFLLYGSMLLPHQLIGGALIVAGIMILIMNRKAAGIPKIEIPES